jgi:hypothetical protein
MTQLADKKTTLISACCGLWSHTHRHLIVHGSMPLCKYIKVAGLLAK